MKEKHSTTGELYFENELLRTMQDASSLRQKVSAAFELLRDPVHRYLYRVLGDAEEAEEAEDLTQEAFLRLYSSLQKGRTGAPLAVGCVGLVQQRITEWDRMPRDFCPRILAHPACSMRWQNGQRILPLVPLTLTAPWP